MKVTEEYINSRIKNISYHKLDRTVTVCCITIDNDYVVTGDSACIDENLYNKDVGEEIAFRNAFESLWPLFGFLLAEKKKENNDR